MNRTVEKQKVKNSFITDGKQIVTIDAESEYDDVVNKQISNAFEKSANFLDIKSNIPSENQ